MAGLGSHDSLARLILGNRAPTQPCAQLVALSPFCMLLTLRLYARIGNVLYIHYYGYIQELCPRAGTRQVHVLETDRSSQSRNHRESTNAHILWPYVRTAHSDIGLLRPVVTSVSGHARRTSLPVGVAEGCGPSIESLTEAHSTEEHQSEDGKIRQLAEDDEQERKSLVGGARPSIDVVIEHDDLSNLEGIAKPDDGQDHTSERSEDALGAGDTLLRILAHV